jgi:hypothetical protein
MIQYPWLALAASVFGLIGILTQDIAKSEATGYFLGLGILLAGIRAALISDWVTVVFMILMIIWVIIFTRDIRIQKKQRGG